LGNIMPSASLTPETLRQLNLTGERIYLRPVVPSDATPSYVGWLNDPETTRYLESGAIRETADSIAAYIQRYQNNPNALFLAIVLKDGDRHVGNIKLEPINWRHQNAILGIMIGDPTARGRGIGCEAIALTLRYCFDVLQLHRVALGVAADNLPGIRCYQKIGFQEEGRLREAIRREHGFVDSHWMAILANEFRHQKQP
jgi:RimJ/RimL family protein N-acetyltransferase